VERRAGGYTELIGRVTSRVVEPLLDAADVGDADRVRDVATGPRYVAAAARTPAFGQSEASATKNRANAVHVVAN
jgi:hypothetical protein